jgi:hypothetical protein
MQPEEQIEAAAAPTISDAWIAERWPDQDPAEVRRRFDALMDKLGETPWRGVPRYADTMANVLASTARLPEQRVADIAAALAAVPEHLRNYEWFAADRVTFGEHYVYGDDGHGMGRQAIAGCPGGKAFNLAPFIAAASPKNIAALLAEVEHLRAAAPAPVEDWREEVIAEHNGETSACDKCGAEYPSAPTGTIHKCGRCSGGYCSRLEYEKRKAAGKTLSPSVRHYGEPDIHARVWHWAEQTEDGSELTGRTGTARGVGELEALDRLRLDHPEIGRIKWTKTEKPDATEERAGNFEAGEEAFHIHADEGDD